MSNMTKQWALFFVFYNKDIPACFCSEVNYWTTASTWSCRGTVLLRNCQFYWTCGADLAIYRAWCHSTAGVQMCKEATQNTLCSYFSWKMKAVRDTCCNGFGGSPSEGSSASWTPLKTPSSAFWPHLHHCPPPLHHIYMMWHQSSSDLSWTCHINVVDAVSAVVLPFKAVTLLPSFVKIRLKAEGSFGLLVLSCCGFGAECRSSFQLGSHSFGVTAVVTGACTIWGLISKKLGDGGMATANRRTRDSTV